MSIRQRKTAAGEERFDVRFRRGGRYSPVEHSGTFKTRAEAELRMEAVGRELAQTFRPPPRKPPAPPEQVYFARLGDLVKIGVSTNPARRARALSAVLLATLDGGRTLEAALHREFARLRVRGEWFRATPRLLTRIEELP